MKQALKPIKRRIRLMRCVRGLEIGLLACLAACLALVVVSFFVPIEGIARYLLLTLVCIALGGVIGLLWPVTTALAARRADACGLKERAITALALEGEDTPMLRLQRADALEHVHALPVRKAMPLGLRPKLWISAAAMAAAVAVLLIVPNPQHDVLRARQTERQVLRTQADELERAAEKMAEEGLTEEEQRELRRITSDMARELRTADNKRDALESLAEKQKDMDKLQSRIQARNADEFAATLGNQSSLKALSQAMQSGSESEIAEALEALAAAMESPEGQQALSEQLAAAAQAAAAGAGQQGLSASAAAAASGNAQQAMQSLAGAVQAGMSGASGANAGGNVAALMSMVRSGMAASGSGNASAMGQGGSGGSGRGNSAGMGAGGGAGMGSTNQDGGYSEGLSQSGQQMGSGGFADRIGAYERIYDPTRLGDGGEISHVQGEEHEGDTQQMQLGAGQGDLSGSVPYNQVVGAYSQAAAQAMRQGALPATLQDWVQRYFNALIE